MPTPSLPTASLVSSEPTPTDAPADSAAAAYPLAQWRLLVDTEPRTGAWNMALDEAIMDAVSNGDAPPTLRFFQWEPPALSLGRRQPLEGVDLARCAADGVDVVRRATGGWAILHTDEFTYSVACRGDDPRIAGPILDAYRALSEGLIAGLARLGVVATMRPARPEGTHQLSAACFEVPSAYEVTVGERKLIGSAQARMGTRILQHGSLPLRGEIARVVNYLTFPDEQARATLADRLRGHAITLGEALGRDITFEEVVPAMTQGFAAALTLDLIPGAPTPEELAAAEAKLDEKRVTQSTTMA